MDNILMFNIRPGCPLDYGDEPVLIDLLYWDVQLVLNSNTHDTL